MNEMMKLQGMNPETFNQVVSDKELGQQVGNAMSVNVIERIILQIMKHTQPRDSSVNLHIDHWGIGSALLDLIEEDRRKWLADWHDIEYKPGTDANEVMKKLAQGEAASTRPRETLSRGIRCNRRRNQGCKHR